MVDFKKCPGCDRLVVPKPRGSCPSCRGSLEEVDASPDDEPKPETAQSASSGLTVDTKCPDCSLINPPGALRCDCGYSFAEREFPATYQVLLPTGESKRFGCFHDLQEDVLSSNLSRSARIRKIPAGIDPNRWVAKYSTMEKHRDLRSLYRPVWDRALKYAKYGAFAGSILAGIGAASGVFWADETTSRISYASLALVVLSFPLFKVVPKIAAFVSAVGFVLWYQVGHADMSLLLVALIVMVGSCSATVSAGAIVGTVAGHFGKTKLRLAPDAQPEVRPYLVALILAVVLPVAISAAAFWGRTLCVKV